MLKTGKKLNRPRRYSRDFKRQLVSEYERGESTVLELSRRYQIAYQVIYRWIKEYSLYNQQEYLIVEKSKSKSAALKSAQSRIRELERALGQKQLELEYLHKLLDLAKTDLGIDLKKNATPNPGLVSGKPRKDER